MKLEGYRTYICFAIYLVLALLDANSVIKVPAELLGIIAAAGGGALASKVQRGR